MKVLVLFVEVTEYNLALIERVYSQMPEHCFSYVFVAMSKTGHETARALPEGSVVLSGKNSEKIRALKQIINKDKFDFAVINGYITYIIMMFNNALAYGLQPVASVNNGAKQHGRLKEALNWSIIVQVVLSLVLTAAVLLFATQLSNFFDGGDPVLTEASAHAVRIMCAASALGFMATIVSSYFQAVEKVVLATIVSLLRYVILACPLMVLVSNMMGTVDGVWYGLLAADVLCGIICLALVFVENRRLDGLKSA